MYQLSNRKYYRDGSDFGVSALPNRMRYIFMGFSIIKNYTFNPSTKEVVFLCDNTACLKPCSKSECKHTFDVSHAKNFKEVAPGKYMEMEEKKDDTGTSS